MSIDTNSDDWRQIEEFCKTRLSDMRKQNDNPMGKVDTADLRGQIKFAKEILDLGNKEEKVLVQEESYID